MSPVFSSRMGRNFGGPGTSVHLAANVHTVAGGKNVKGRAGSEMRTSICRREMMIICYHGWMLLVLIQKDTETRSGAKKTADKTGAMNTFGTIESAC